MSTKSSSFRGATDSKLRSKAIRMSEFFQLLKFPWKKLENCWKISAFPLIKPLKRWITLWMSLKLQFQNTFIINVFLFSVRTDRHKSLGQIEGRFVEDSFTKGFVKKTRKKHFLREPEKKRERYFLLRKNARQRERVCACVRERERMN
jgi:hypothetical protein